MTVVARLIGIALAVVRINGDLLPRTDGVEVALQPLTGSDTSLLHAKYWQEVNDTTQTKSSSLRKHRRAFEDPDELRPGVDIKGGSTIAIINKRRFLGSSIAFEHRVAVEDQRDWHSGPWGGKGIKDFHVVPPDSRANETNIGIWHPGKLALQATKSWIYKTSWEYSPIMGVRIGITPPSEDVDNTFVDWVEMVPARGTIDECESCKPNKSSKRVYDTTRYGDKFYVPNFRVTGFRLKRFDESRSEFQKPRNSSLDFPNKSDFVGVTDIIFYGYQLLYDETNRGLRVAHPPLGPFIPCDENQCYSSGTWRERFNCGTGEHVVGFASKSDVEGKKTFGDDAGLTGLRLLCSRGAITPTLGSFLKDVIPGSPY